MSYLVEQAGGIATDGHQRILDIKPVEVRKASHCQELFAKFNIALQQLIYMKKLNRTLVICT